MRDPSRASRQHRGSDAEPAMPGERPTQGRAGVRFQSKHPTRHAGGHGPESPHQKQERHELREGRTIPFQAHRLHGGGQQDQRDGEVQHQRVHATK